MYTSPLTLTNLAIPYVYRILYTHMYYIVLKSIEYILYYDSKRLISSNGFGEVSGHVGVDAL